MSEPLISVIVPVYNTEKYVERCIRSILKNDYQNLEILCINDGSKDHSLAVLQSLAEQDSRIKVIDQVNSGVSCARNAGLELATGEYVSFIDSDDWIHPRFFSELVAEAIRNRADMTVGQYLETYDVADDFQDAAIPSDKEVKIMFAREAMGQDGYIRRNVWGRLFARKTIRDVRFPVGIQYGEDTLFNLMALKDDSNKVVFMNVPLLYYYKGRNDSLVHISSYDSHLLLGNWILDHLDLFYLRDIAIVSAFSLFLTYRYEGAFWLGRKASKLANSKLKKCMKLLQSQKNCPLSTKVKYRALIAFPFAYRIARILADPTFMIHDRLLKERAAKDKATQAASK